MENFNIKKQYKSILLGCVGIGTLKGLYYGIKRCNIRNCDDNCPIIKFNDSLISTISTSGIIITGSSILGGLQGGLVGLLFPINLTVGIYQYIKNKRNVDNLEDIEHHNKDINKFSIL